MAAEFYYKDNATVRKAKEVYYNDNGTVRKAEEIWYNDNGTMRKVFASSVTVKAGNFSNSKGQRYDQTRRRYWFGYYRNQIGTMSPTTIETEKLSNGDIGYITITSLGFTSYNPISGSRTYSIRFNMTVQSSDGLPSKIEVRFRDTNGTWTGWCTLKKSSSYYTGSAEVGAGYAIRTMMQRKTNTPNRYELRLPSGYTFL